MSRLITTLDLGSKNIRAASCILEGLDRLKISALADMPSNGIASGNIVDLDAACNDVSNIIKKLQKKIGRKIKSVSVGLSGPGLSGFVATGMVGLSKRPRQIWQGDIERCEKISNLTQIPVDRQIVQEGLHSYYINEGEKVLNPIGLYATKLSVKTYIVTSDASKVKNIRQCMEHAGLMLENLVFSGSALAESVFTEEDKKNKNLLLDIGSRSTNISLLDKGNLIYIDYLPKGADDIQDDNSIASYFRGIKKYIKDNDFSKTIITGGGALKDNILENAESILGTKTELGRIKLKWCSLDPKDSFLHMCSLGVAAYEAKRLTRGYKKYHPLKQAFKFLNNIFESYF